MNKIIEIENLSFGYDNTFILKDIDFIVEEGDFWGIIGPNGAGKTTLIKIILGLLRPKKGKVEVFGKAPWKLGEERKKIGYIAQRAEIESYFPIRVWDLVLLGRKVVNNWRNISKEDEEIVERALNHVEMWDYKDKLFRELSGGQQQRVLVAKALVQEPKLLVLDEPTIGVDITTQEKFYSLLQYLNKKGLTIILVSHDIGVITKRVNKLACLNRRIFLHGCPKDLRLHKTLKEIYGEEFLLLTHEGEEKQ
ncbi:MAG: metal ABC transporter ATP-binding protein [Dictyoglomus sp.]|nr:metal ABC transporter ATP-binding protein [Dictyoglomus sp.]MDW8187909.1 metal ABC transporter ATP-binding protein [Dictyoglomus sp.]